jgi:hypothetical protein
MLAAEARGALRRELQVCAQQIALGGAPLQLGPVSIRTVVRGAVAALPSPVQERLTAPSDAAGPDTVCCADPVWLHRLLVHLLLEATTGAHAASRVELRIEFGTPGEAHLVLSASDASLLAGSAAELGVVKSLLELMGGDLVLEPRRAGSSPLRLVLKALPCAVRLRCAA